MLIAGSAAGAQGTSQPAIRALFIGNSYTYFNSLPNVIKMMAKAANDPRTFTPTCFLVGGSTLKAHIDRGALAEVAKGYDYVILQDQSDRPIDDPNALRADVTTIAAAVAKTNAKLMLYESWAKEAKPATQDSLSHTMERAAKDHPGTILARVGDAWKMYRDQEGTIAAGGHSALFRPDGSHPTPVGTYLAASVMFEEMYGKSPIGLPPNSMETTTQPPLGQACPEANQVTIPDATAKLLQNLAAKVK